MIFLWNYERVIYEIMELARIRIARDLDIGLEYVYAKVSYGDGKLNPSFTIDPKEVPIKLLGKVETTIGDIWLGLRSELNSRLASVGKRRDDYGYKKGSTQTDKEKA